MKLFSIQNRRYLGSKTKLIPFIQKVVKENCKDINSFMDLCGDKNVCLEF